ncbi:MAG: leucine-rich repeat protein [Methanomethylophilus alvi]|nr:leucine-rich repeat protein [Methanomethylophilus alvi]
MNDSDSSEAASETSGSCGADLAWSYDSSTGALTVTGSGSMTDFSYSDTRWGGNDIKSVSLPDGLTSIGEVAFYGCTSLSSVTIPDSVTSIGYYAFSGCTSLSSVTIPDSVTSIGSYAFSGCTSLSSVAIPDSVTSIGSYAFSGCTSLTAINVAEGNTAYVSENGVLFNKSKTSLIQYPAGKTDSAYTIPDSVTSIGYCAFLSADSLKSIEVSGNNPNFSSRSGCLYDKTGMTLRVCPAGLGTFTVGKDVAWVYSGAFSGNNLNEVVFSEGASATLGEGAFYDCMNLKKIVIESNANVVFNVASIGFPDSEKHTIYVVAPEGYTIPESALYGNIEIVYSEHPSDSEDRKEFPIIYVVIGAIAVLALAGGAIVVKKRKA